MNIIPAAISIGISALLAYTFYTYGITGSNSLIAICSFITFSGCLLSLFGIKYGSYYSSVNSRTLSVLFFLAFLAIAIFFSFVYFDTPVYIIITGITALLYLLFIYYSVKGQSSNIIK